MKKFLSIILALSIILVPIEALSCFANGGKDDVGQNPLDIVKVRTCRPAAEQIVIVANINSEGEFEAKVGLDYLDGGFFDMHKLRKGTVMHDEANGYLRSFRILEEIRRLNCERATVLMVHSGLAFANFFDKDGKIVKTCMY